MPTKAVWKEGWTSGEVLSPFLKCLFIATGVSVLVNIQECLKINIENMDSQIYFNLLYVYLVVSLVGGMISSYP